MTPIRAIKRCTKVGAVPRQTGLDELRQFFNVLRGDTSIEKRVEYDLYHVRHGTLAFDLFIVLLTFVRGFTDKNAY